MLGISVFGIAATRPEQIAQDLRLMAPHVDYVAPMVYPSHWGRGEYGVADPNRQPAAIVGASVGDFTHGVAGSGAAVVPWLQDFSAGGVAYGPVEVRAQIDAALATAPPASCCGTPARSTPPKRSCPRSSHLRTERAHLSLRARRSIVGSAGDERGVELLGQGDRGAISEREWHARPVVVA